MKKKQADEMLRADAIASAISSIRENIKLKRCLAISVTFNAILLGIILYML